MSFDVVLKNEMIRRVPRHISIAIAAAFVGFFTLPGMFGPEIGSALKGLSVLGAMVSAILWLGFSLMLWRPKTQQWLILGFVSPFLGGSLLFLSLALMSGDIRSVSDLFTALGIGFGWAVTLVWIVVPIGIGMGFIASLIARAWREHEAEPQR